MADSTLIYIGDPMCSWCWGFAPVLESLAVDHSVEVIVGGLRPGPAAETLGRLGSHLSSTWNTISERTGQQFDTGILERLPPDWLYDTEPAARSVVAMRQLASDQTLRWFTRLQEGFYLQGIDIVDLGTHGALAADLDVDVDLLMERIASPEVTRATWDDFNTARRMGVSGFPTLLRDRGGRLEVVTPGYASEADVRAALGSRT